MMGVRFCNGVAWDLYRTPAQSLPVNQWHANVVKHLQYTCSIWDPNLPEEMP